MVGIRVDNQWIEMQAMDDKRITRREFMRDAALAAGAVAVGIGQAHADVQRRGKPQPLSGLPHQSTP